MAFIFGTSPDYQAFADILRRVAIGTSLQNITAIATGGTGYVAGNILTVSGGTSVVAAQIEVLTVGGSGEVLTARIRNAGLYTTTPANDASVTGGSGTGATFTLSWGTNGWTSRRATNCANALQSAAVAVGGTGYAVNDVLTVSGGTFSSQATVRVATVDGGGAVTSVVVVNQGDYTTAPANPASTTGGSGTGCTLNLTFGSGEREIILEGSGSGSDEIIVGWKTFFDSASGARNMILHGFTGYEPALPYNDQPGRSPGLETASTGTDQGGCYVPLSNSIVTWWISVTPRRIVFVAKVGTCYGTGHLGFLNPFATAGEWPYPMFIAGSTNNRFTLPSDSTIHTSGFMDPVSASLSNAGPGLLRTADGQWRSVYNSSIQGSNRLSRSSGEQVYPAGRISSPSGVPSEDSWYGNSLPWDQFIPSSGIPGTQQARLLRTTFSGGDRFVRLPATIIGTSPNVIYGEVDGCFWFDAAATGIVPENRFTDGDERFTVFNNGQRGDNWARWALRED